MEKNGNVNGQYVSIGISERSRRSRVGCNYIYYYVIQVAPHWDLNRSIKQVTYRQSKGSFSWDKIADRVKECYQARLNQLVRDHASKNVTAGVRTKKTELIEEFGLGKYTSVVNDSCGKLVVELSGLDQDQARELLKTAQRMGVVLK